MVKKIKKNTSYSYNDRNIKPTLSEEDKVKFERMLEMLDDCEDVQQVYHNVDLED